MPDNQALQLAINRLQDQKEDLEAEYNKVNTRFITASIVFGVCVIGEIFVRSYWGLWSVVIVISMVVWLNNAGKRRNLARKIAEITQELLAKGDQGAVKSGRTLAN
jgi:hypothetical protein